MHPNKQKGIVAGNPKRKILKTLSAQEVNLMFFLQKGNAICVVSSLASGFLTMMLTDDILRYGKKSTNLVMEVFDFLTISVVFQRLLP